MRTQLRSLLAIQGGGGGAAAPDLTYLAGAVVLGTASGATVTAPAGSVADDTLILVVHVGGQATGLNSTPSGWTLRASDAYTTTNHVAVYTRTAAGSGAANNVATGAATGADRLLGYMFAVQGASAVTVGRCGFVDETFIARASSPSSTLEIDGITPPGAGQLHCFAGNGSATSDLGVPAFNDSLVQDLDYYTTGGDNYSMTHGYKDTDGSATADPITVTNVANNDAAYGILLTVT